MGLRCRQQFGGLMDLSCVPGKQNERSKFLFGRWTTLRPHSQDSARAACFVLSADLNGVSRGQIVGVEKLAELRTVFGNSCNSAGRRLMAENLEWRKSKRPGGVAAV